jgi:hypothetical protein
MIYFKKLSFQKDSDKQTFERALRKFAIKRHTSLDLQSSSTDVGTDKSFLGLEGKKGLKFTRIRTSFERWLPKLIISLPKDAGLNYYRVRLTILSTLVLVMLTLLFILALVSLIWGKMIIGNFGIISIIYGGYLSLVLLELSLTKGRVKSSIKRL